MNLKSTADYRLINGNHLKDALRSKGYLRYAL